MTRPAAIRALRRRTGSRTAARRPPGTRADGRPPTVALGGVLALLTVVAAARAGEVEILMLDGSTVAGRVVELTPRIRLEAAGQTRSLGWDDVLALRPVRADAPVEAPSDAGPFWFLLADSSRFRGAVDSATDVDFVVRLDVGGTCRLSTAAVRRIEAVAPAEAARERIAQLEADLAQRPVRDDHAVIARGEQAVVLRGSVRVLGAQEVVFLWNGQALRLPWSRVMALYFGQSEPRSASATVRLRDGQVFSGRVRRGDGESIAIQSSVFDGLELPWSRIEQIESVSERVVYLSELAPQSYEFEPFFEKRWPYALDRTLSGAPIRLGGRAYARGVCMHSRSNLTYRLDGRYRLLAFVVGIVDEAGSRGDVTLRVLGDGQPLWEAAGVRGGDEPRAAVIDVSGVAELSLVVDYGADLDLSDHVGWAFARLIR